MTYKAQTASHHCCFALGRASHSKLSIPPQTTALKHWWVLHPWLIIMVFSPPKHQSFTRIYFKRVYVYSKFKLITLHSISIQWIQGRLFKISGLDTEVMCMKNIHCHKGYFKAENTPLKRSSSHQWKADALGIRGWKRDRDMNDCNCQHKGRKERRMLYLYLIAQKSHFIIHKR